MKSQQGWKRIRDVCFANLRCHSRLSCHNSALSPGRELNAAAAIRGGADSSEALCEAKFSDSLYQVGTLKIAREWADPNAKTLANTFRRLLTDYKVKCVTALRELFAMSIWRLISERSARLQQRRTVVI